MTNPPTTLTAGNTVVIFQKLFFEPHTILRGCIECMLPVYALIVLTDIKTQTTRLRWLRRRLKPAHRRTIAELRPFRRLRPKITATLRIAALARSRHHTGSLTARPSRAGSGQHRARFHGQDVEVFLHPPCRVRRAAALLPTAGAAIVEPLREIHTTVHREAETPSHPVRAAVEARRLARIRHIFARVRSGCCILVGHLIHRHLRGRRACHRGTHTHTFRCTDPVASSFAFVAQNAPVRESSRLERGNNCPSRGADRIRPWAGGLRRCRTAFSGIVADITCVCACRSTCDASAGFAARQEGRSITAHCACKMSSIGMHRHQTGGLPTIRPRIPNCTASTTTMRRVPGLERVTGNAAFGFMNWDVSLQQSYHPPEQQSLNH